MTMNLEFDEILHQYKLDGRPVPSVTKILSPLVDFSMVAPAVLERKRTLGSALHKCIELYLLDDLEVSSIHEEVKPYFEGFLKFMAETKFEIISAETQVYSKKLWYAGTFDLKGTIFGKRALIDTKSVAVLGKSVGPQLAAYEYAHNEINPKEKIQARFALWLKPDGTYRLPEYKDTRDYEIFKSCLNVHNWVNS